MVMYKLMSIVISITTGDVIREEEFIKKPMSMERCILIQSQQKAQYPAKGEIVVFECRQVEVV